MKEMFDDMEKDMCPFCGKEEYVTWKGDEVNVEVGMLQISPDQYECLYCGFEDQESCRFTEEQLIKIHKKKIGREIKASLKWCNYMAKVLKGNTK